MQLDTKLPEDETRETKTVYLGTSNTSSTLLANKANNKSDRERKLEWVELKEVF